MYQSLRQHVAAVMICVLCSYSCTSEKEPRIYQVTPDYQRLIPDQNGDGIEDLVWTTDGVSDTLFSHRKTDGIVYKVK